MTLHCSLREDRGRPSVSVAEVDIVLRRRVWVVAAVAVEALERRSTEVEGPPGPQPMSRWRTGDVPPSVVLVEVPQWSLTLSLLTPRWTAPEDSVVVPAQATDGRGRGTAPASAGGGPRGRARAPA
eukprot:TRINITY_DN5223_c0_g1_i1.p1 TRINITY_DN5223_c0_g1~~TRINITY_DN5223_c0_g1_i1.p1  ORF type:complete len:126 (-),score=12.05 TRINITY_DN5223_c0_g1_i1:51-428(-)